jgi:hypothetical protein
MRRIFFALMGMAACGGDDSTITPPGDGGGPQNDGNNGADTSNGTDANNGTDSGAADTSTAPDAASFNIKGINGLALWLKGDVGVTADGAQKISTWADQSGNGNDGTNSGAGAYDSRPTAVASGINGLPTVHFASTACTSGCTGFYGDDLFICQPCSHASMNWGTGDYLVEVVARYTNDPTSVTGDGFGALYISIYGPPETATAGVGLYGNVPALNNNAKSSGIEAFNGGQPAAVSSGTGYNNNMPHVFAMQRSGTSLSVRLDGAAVGTSTVAAIDLGNNGGRLGGCENSTKQRLDGDISEVIAVKGTVSAGDLATIESYLKARYATP